MIYSTDPGLPFAVRRMAVICDVPLPPTNFDLREDRLLAESTHHREGFQDRSGHRVERLNHSGAGGERRNELASGQVSDIGECECAGPSMKRICPVNENLILPLWKTRERFGYVVPRNSKKYHFTSRCLLLGGSRRSWPKLIDNFSEAVGTAAVAKLNLVACLQCLFCERLCESSRSNGSNFHTRSFLR